MPTVSTTKMNARQFQSLGEDPPGVRLELVNGEVAVNPSPRPDHANVVGELYYMLRQHIEARALGKLLMDVDTLVDDWNVRRPDLFFVRKERLGIITDRAVEGPPDLCVEVVSPASGSIDRHDKLDQYARFGVPFYWIADPQQRTLEGFRLENNRYEPTGSASGDEKVSLPPFEELTIPLNKLWRRGSADQR